MMISMVWTQTMRMNQELRVRPHPLCTTSWVNVHVAHIMGVWYMISQCVHILACVPHWSQHFEESWGDKKVKLSKGFHGPGSLCNNYFIYWTPWVIIFNIVYIISIDQYPYWKIQNTSRSSSHPASQRHKLSLLCRASAVVQAEWIEGGSISWRTNWWMLSEIIWSHWCCLDNPKLDFSLEGLLHRTMSGRRVHQRAKEWDQSPKR